MKMGDAGPRGTILTVDELAARWGCETSTVLAMVKTRDVPYFQVGQVKRLDRRGPKDLRFRLAAIEEWERSVESTWKTPESVAAKEHKAEAQAAAYGWDGKSRLKGRYATGPRRDRLGP